MAKKMRTAIEPTRMENYPKWYLNVIAAADLAENSPVRGCMVIKPWGYSIWENIKTAMDKMFKKTGVKNAYFPIFIPKSFLEKEAAHVDGFAKECAVVTHHRLTLDKEGKLIPAGELEEPLIVRPTSETIIGAMFSKWVQSYRDLPLLINQWANVVRWEMRTRLFLRTAEFLWQEGHTVHETSKDAMDKTIQMLDVYADFAENFLAIPVIKGEKTAAETFPGAVKTLCIEAMMQDKKALQAGTSHFLGQNFSKASNIKYLSSKGVEEYAWTTSWGVSTRLIGGIIMTHADDNGMVMPPKISPSHIAIIPMFWNDDEKKEVMEYCNKLKIELEEKQYHKRDIDVVLDNRELRGGEKVWSWIKKGIPLRVEIGPRDIASNSVFVGRRDKEVKDKFSINRDEFINSVTDILDDIQSNIFEKAKNYRDDNTKKIDDINEFKDFFTAKSRKRPEIHGGFSYSHWCGNSECEEKMKKDLAVTIRCIPLNNKKEKGKCIVCGKDSEQRVIFAKSY